MKQVLNHKEMTNRRKQLRTSMTESERILWSCLNKATSKARFVRQYSIESFVIDFYCRRLRLAIEIDGGVHDLPDQTDYDRFRETYISNYDVTFLRFTNEEIKHNLSECLKKINCTINSLL